MEGEGRFGWGIVGTGAIAAQFASDLRLLPDARLAAVASRSLEKAETFCRAWGGARAHAGLAALLADPAVQAVYVATPNSDHASSAIAALRAGKPVLVEKPLATTVAEAERIAAAARETGCFAMEAMWTRFLPAFEHFRATIQGGRIGPIRSVRAELALPRDPSMGERFFDPALGGGAALDLGVYPLSLALALFGCPRACTGRSEAARTGVDLSAQWRLDYGTFTAELACGFDREGDNRFIVEGEGSTLILDRPFLKAESITRLSASGRRNPLAALSPASLPGKILSRLPMPGRQRSEYPFQGTGLGLEAEAVMEAVREGRREHPAMPLADSIEVLRMVESAQNALRTR